MILVTGGTGLVGSHLLYELLQKHDCVKAIYRRPHKLEVVKHVFSYYTKNVDFFYNKIEWIKTDINDVPGLENAFIDVNYVYHCAAFVSFEPDKYSLLRKINIEGTANIVNLCLAFKIKKLCYVSSVAAIGQEINDNIQITEETIWDPENDNSVYAITKYGAEIEVWRGSQEQLDVVIVNPGVIIGPGFWNGGGSSGLIKKAHKGLKYYSKGATGYIDVKDVVSVMINLMESTISNERFILISENLSFKDFLEKTSLSLNVRPPQKEAPSFLLGLLWRLDWLNWRFFGKRRRLSKQMAKSIQTKTSFNNMKVKNATDMTFISMDQSIQQTAKFFLADQNT